MLFPYCLITVVIFLREFDCKDTFFAKYSKIFYACKLLFNFC